MNPILFEDLLHHVGIAGLPAFFFMVMIATFAAAYAAVKFAEQDKLSVVIVLDMAIIAVVASMLGARIFHVIVEAPDYYGLYPWDPSLFVRVFYFWQGGFVSLGAILATVGAWLLYLRWRKVAQLAYFDNMSRVFPVIDFFVRLGCLLTGCCYGRPTDFPLNIIFTDPSSTAHYYYPGIPLHPTQIYFMANAVLMFFILQWIHKHRRFYGQIAASFLMLYGVSRFLIEFLRGDADRGVYLQDSISTGQIVMAGFFGVGILLYKWCQKRFPIT